MTRTKGKVEATSEKETSTGKPKYGVKLGGKWYNGWGQVPKGIERDMEVEIEYDTDKWGNNIKSITPADTTYTPATEVKSVPQPTSRDDYWTKKEARDIAREPVISRFAALKLAIASLGEGKDIDAYLNRSEEFRRYAEKGLNSKMPNPEKKEGPEAIHG